MGGDEVESFRAVEEWLSEEGGSGDHVVAGLDEPVGWGMRPRGEFRGFAHECGCTEDAGSGKWEVDRDGWLEGVLGWGVLGGGG